MIAYLWPFLLAVLSTVIYQVCAKSLPAEVNPLASLTLTYLVSAIAAGILFFCTARGTSLMGEYHKVNWTSFVLGIVIVGLEVGMIYAYKAGWQTSVLPVAQCAVCGIIMIFVGSSLYGEAITSNKLIGIVVCLVGLYILNK